MKPFIEKTFANGEVVMIDWNSPDEQLMAMEGDEPSDADCDALKDVPPDALLTILRFIIRANPRTGRAKRWRVAQLRLAVLAHAAGLPDVADRPLATLADELGCTRALMSLYAINLVDELRQQQVRGGKKRESREAYRLAAIRSHKERGHAMSSDAP